MYFEQFTALIDHTGASLSPETVLNTVTDLAFCHTNHEGFFVEINDAYCELYGYTREELIGNHFTMVLPAEARQAVGQLHTAFIAGENEMPQEWTVMNKNGDLMRIRTQAVRMEKAGQPPAKLTIIERI